MELTILGLKPSHIAALNNKKIYTAEAFLRKPALHAYDFSKIHSLSLNNEETKTAIEKHRPFAIIGNCISCEIKSKDMHIGTKTITKLYLLLRIKEKETGNTLFITSFFPEKIKEMLLDNELNSPLKQTLDYPDDIKYTSVSPFKKLNETCKSQIEYLNNTDFSAIDLISLQTKGADGYSYEKPDPVKDSAFLNWIHALTSDYTRICSAYKWYKRGLRIDIAYKKAITDGYEIISTLMANNKPFIVGGFIEYDENYRTFNLINPIILSSNIDINKNYIMQYSQIKGFPPEAYIKAINTGIEKEYNDFLSENILKDFNILSLTDSFKTMHKPRSYKDIIAAKSRIDFERLFYFASLLKISENKHTNNKGIKLTDKTLLHAYINTLPYELTKDQKTAINELYKKFNSGQSANCLLQGDVGTGKTAVAFCIMLLAIASGYQAAIATPYATLAYQHYKDFSEIANVLNIKIAFITSDTKAKDKKELLKQIEDGSIKAIIGTHSIFSASVKYKNLGLVIFDEEHKFGVNHKSSFGDLALPGFHQITMSATPIPASITKTLYNDCSDIINITEKPKNRIPIQTATCKTDKVILEFMEKQVKLGHQGYIICPSIEDNENSDLVSIEKKSIIYDEYFKTKGIRMSIITGKTSAKEKETIMTDFAEGKINILMATTVIEVGINVPNATVIAILNADRFGYATLHQLRGRVGRGSNKSYCILQSEEKCEKLEFLCNTLSGFEIAEKDLEERGPGELFGINQSGDNMYIESIIENPKLFKEIKDYIKNFDIETLKNIVFGYEECFISSGE